MFFFRIVPLRIYLPIFSLWSGTWTFYPTQRQVNSMPPSSLCSACRNRAVSLGFPAEEVGMGMQVFHGDRRVGLQSRSCGLQGNRGSGTDSGEAKEWLCFKDQRLSPPRRQTVRSHLYSGSLCVWINLVCRRKY